MSISKFVVRSFVVGALAVVVAPAVSGQGDLEKAVRAAFTKEAKDLKVRGHVFHSKKANITVNAGTVTVKGQISHRLRLRPDDQVYYTIVKVQGKIKTVNVEIKRGGILKPLRGVGSAIKQLLGKTPLVSLPASWIETYERSLGKGWEDAAELIVCHIAWRVGANGQDTGRVRDHRTSATPGSTPAKSAAKPGALKSAVKARTGGNQ